MSRRRVVLSIIAVCLFAIVVVVLVFVLPRDGTEAPASATPEVTDAAPCGAALVVLNLNASSIDFAGVGYFPDAWRTADDRDVLEASAELISAARAAGVQLIYFYGDYQWEDEEAYMLFPLSIEPQEGDLVMRRIDYVNDVLEDTELPAILEERGIRTLLFAGLHTGYDINQSARRAKYLGYEVIVVADAHSGWGPAYAEQYNDYWTSEGISVVPTADLDFGTICGMPQLGPATR